MSGVGGFGRGSTLFALSAAAMLVGATSASALGETGLGTATGTSDENPQPVPNSPTLCGKQTTSSTISLTATGTYSAQNVNVYAGTSNVTVTLTAPYYVSPAGSFGGDSTCTTPGTVPATLRITTGTPAPGTVGTVTCSGSGTYQRVNTTVAITFGPPNGSAACTVNGAAATQPLVIRYTGNQLPCFPAGSGPPVPDPCGTPAQQFQLAYTET